MASIKYYVPGKSDNSSIYLRLSLDRTTSIKRKTGLFINPKDWSSATGKPIQNDSVNKDIATELKELDSVISKNVNDASSNGIEMTGDWLLYRIDLHFKRIKKTKVDNSLVGHINWIIEHADTKRLPNGKIGLSKNRVKGYVTFKGIIEAFQTYIKKEIQLSNIDASFEEDFRSWLLVEKGYSTNYAGKNFDNLKAVCTDAKRMGKEVHVHLADLFSFSELDATHYISKARWLYR